MKNLEGNRVSLRKSICFMIITVLTLGILSGCGNKNSVDSNDDINTSSSKNTNNKVSAMGRYVESEVTFPDKIVNKEEELCKLETNEEGKLILYAYSFVGEVKKYTYKSNNEWDCENLIIGDMVLDILKSKCTGLEGFAIIDIQITDNGDIYLLSNLFGNEENKPLLLKMDSGKTLISIPVEGWDKYENTVENYKAYPTATKLAVLSDGSLLIGDYKGIKLFGADGKKIRDYGESNGNTIIVHDDNSFITMNSSGSKVLTYNIESGELISEVATTDSQIVSSEIESDIIVNQDKDGKVYLVNKSGVHTLAEGGSIWETIIDGSLNSISRQDRSFNAFTKASEKFYLAYLDSLTPGLFEYTYDENVTTVPINELSIYSLYNSATIRQAMVSFQQKHTDVKVNYRVAVGDEDMGALDTTDYIKALNTELLAGKGADIIMLDGLDAQTYIEKGVLADISDTINPLEDNNELLSNIVDAYKEEDGKIYSIPSRISIPIAAGDKQAIENYGDLDKMAEYLNSNSEKPLLGTIERSQLIKNLYMLKADTLVNKDKYINEAEMNLFLQNLKKIYDNSDIVSDEESQKYSPLVNFYDNKCQVVYTNFNSISDLEMITSGIKDESTGYTTVNHLFKPCAQLGINSAGQVDLAKEFIQEVLLENIQKTELGDGFPVNVNSLNEWIKKEEDILACFSLSGSNTIVELKWPDVEERNNLLQMYQALTTPISVDSNILDTISKECDTFLSGGESSDEATANIIKASKVYLSE